MGYRDEVVEQVQGIARGYRHVRVNCPACPDRVGKIDMKKSLSVNMSNGWWLCHRCGYRGRLPNFDDDGDEWDDDDGWEDVEEDGPPYEEPSDFIELPGRALALQCARDYLLTRRRVAPHVIAELGMGYARKGKHAGRIIMPVVGSGGVWHGWVGRAINESIFPPYYTSPGLDRRRRFFNDRIVDDENRKSPLIVTEGPFDALRWWPHAVACLGKPTEDHITRLASVRSPIIIALDGDAWREGVGVAAALRLRGCRAYALALPPTTDLDSLPVALVRDGIRFALTEKTDADLRASAGD